MLLSMKIQNGAQIQDGRQNLVLIELFYCKKLWPCVKMQISCIAIASKVFLFFSQYFQKLLFVNFSFCSIYFE
jgi:hypothetical protein